MTQVTIPGVHGAHFLPEVIQAYFFASAAHAAVGQERKYTGEPYITHPVGVLQILWKACPKMLNVEMMQAALLHDVVEDTGVTLELVRFHFGPVVAGYVQALSTATTTSFGNRTERHKVEVERLSRAVWRVQTIKVADLIHNTRTIVEHDPKFARIYLPEKKALLDAMTSCVLAVKSVASAQLAVSALKLGMTL